MIPLPQALTALEILLKILIGQYLNSSYCITIISDEYLFLQSPKSFMYIYASNNETLTYQMLNASEMGCSDYIVQLNEPNMFFVAYENVARMGNVRKGDRKIIMLPTFHHLINGSSDVILNVLSNREASFLANILLIMKAESSPECHIYDLVTHKFVGIEENDKPVVLDSWNSCTEEFEKNVYLFPHNMSNVYGKIVKVTAFTYKPYVLLDLEPNITPNGRDGLDIRIVEEFCRWINCTIEMVGDDGREWGEIYDNRTGIGILGNVYEDRADLGITALYSWYEEYIVMDFSTPYVRTGVTCVAPSPRLLASWRMPLLPFNLYMWICIFFTFIYASLALMIAKGFSTTDIFLTTFGIMITQSQPESGFSTWRTRSVIGWMMMTGLVLDNAYGGGLASTFTVPRYEPSIDTIKDIVDRKLIWGATHDAWTFSLILSQEPLLKKLVKLFRTYPSEDLKRRSFNRSMAFSIEKLPGGTFAIGEYITKEATFDLTIMLEEYYFEQCIVMMRKNSFYTHKLSKLIGRLHESGLLLAWETQIALQYLDYKVQLAVKLSRSKKDVENIEPLALRHVEGIFIIYGVGVVISIISFVIEIIQKKRNNKRR
uniref:Ionotropic receptor 41a n=1 Tax=Heliconius melpomene rosina TaxID=171916 RepID=A0A140G9G8_HELME|nr:ionotropic receptor 41a [Heliconius melpomene rosina]